MAGIVIDEELAWEWMDTYELALRGDAAIDGYDCEETLHARSALEFVRATLSPEQVAILDAADALWKANPEAFNACFAYDHASKSVETELGGYAMRDGKTVPIPREHWWWWPLEAPLA